MAGWCFIQTLWTLLSDASRISDLGRWSVHPRPSDDIVAALIKYCSLEIYDILFPIREVGCWHVRVTDRRPSVSASAPYLNFLPGMNLNEHWLLNQPICTLLHSVCDATAARKTVINDIQECLVDNKRLWHTLKGHDYPTSYAAL